MGPCLCGDTYCSSCGPAQGNSRCEICGKWTEDGGCDNPAECEAAANEMYAQLAAEEARHQELADAYWKGEAERNREPQLCPHERETFSCVDCLTASDLAFDAAREKRHSPI